MARGHTVDGQPDGYWERFRVDGSKLRSGYFSTGRQTGEWTTYDRNGDSYKVTRPGSTAMQFADASIRVDDPGLKLPATADSARSGSPQVPVPSPVTISSSVAPERTECGCSETTSLPGRASLSRRLSRSH